MYYLPKILELLRPYCKKNSDLTKDVKIAGGCYIYHSKVNRHTYIGKNTQIIHTEIGKFCSIAAECTIGGGEHAIDFVSTSPLFNKGRNIFRKNFAKHEFCPYKKTEIGNDVWIGHGVMIKGGVKIGDGAIIGMGAIVTKDVPPYAIVAGNPAKLIRFRFDDDIIKKLLEMKWWDWDNGKIEQFGKFFNSPESLFKAIDKI